MMTVSTQYFQLTATDARRAIEAGTLSAEDLARACIARTAEREPVLRAWSYLDPRAVIDQARELDKQLPRGKLHGIPIGIKDIINTRDMPTEHNSPIYRGQRPSHDAACVETLRAAGALIFGKTETLEFADCGRAAPTRNPHDPMRTPGASSAGSAAAVADCHVPLALATQTGGSAIRPASYCGIHAFKPTWNVVSPEGVKLCSATCDTLAWYGRSVADLALLCDVFGIEDDTPPTAVDLASGPIALCRSPVWDRTEPATRDALDAAARVLRDHGATIVELELPPEFAGLNVAHRTICASEARAAFLNEYRAHFDLLHDEFRAKVENRAGHTRAALAEAHNLAARCRAEFDRIADDFAAVLTPSATGEAPVGVGVIGDAALNRMWTLLHAPCVNLPAFVGPHGMPVGVTLTTRRYADRQILQVAEAASAAFEGA
jgi:Asp-tRNA(Asn)/Glu-tRNA(Gln) amidotransferase A subunit family amidase